MPKKPGVSLQIITPLPKLSSQKFFKKFNFNNILTKTNASIKNIKPMIEKKDSLTRALFFHPLISYMLFSNKGSQLGELVFAHQNKTRYLQINFRKK